MEEKSNIPSQTLNPSKDIRSAIVKLWELIYSMSEQRSALISQKSDLEKHFSRVLAGMKEQENQGGELQKKKIQLEKDIIKNHETIENQKKQIEELTLRLESSAVSDIDSITKENKKLKDNLSKLQEFSVIIDEMNIELENVKKERDQALESAANQEQNSSGMDKLKEDYAFAQKEIARKNIELYERNEENLRMKDTISELDSKLKAIQQVEAELQSLTENNFNLVDELNNKTNEIEQLNKLLEADQSKNKIRIEGLMNEKMKLLSAITTLQNETGSGKEELAAINAKIAELKESLMEKDRKYDEAVATRNQLKSELDNLRKFRDASSVNEKRIEDLTLKVTEFSTQKELNEEIIDSLQLKVKELETEIYRLRKELDNEQFKYESSQQLIKAQEDKIHEFDEQVNEFKKKIEDKNKECERLESKVGEMKISTEEAEKDKTSNLEMIEENQKLKDQNNALVQRADELNEEIKSLKNELLLSNTRLTDYSNRFMRMEEQAKVLEDRLKVSEEAVNELKTYEKRFYNLQKEYSQLHLKIEEAESNSQMSKVENTGMVESLKIKVDKLNKELSSVKKMNAEFEEKSRNLVNTLNIKNDQVRKLELELHDYLDKTENDQKNKDILIDIIESKIEYLDRVLDS